MNEVLARLIVKLGPNPKKEYTLSQPEITIGRSPRNSVVIINPEVSRRHAMLHRDGDNYFIEDCGSTNGTFVSGQRIMGNTILRHGDEIRFGDSIALLYIKESESTVSPAVDQILIPDPEITIVDTTLPQAPADKIEREPQLSPSFALQEAAVDDFILPDQQDTTTRNRLRLFGCGCTILFLPFLCLAVLIFLDIYEQGRFLYCGPIRPFFEIFLGPIGFAPICP